MSGASNGKGTDCVICLTPLLESIGALRCGHVFHQDCIAQWVAQGKGKCPQCNKACRLEDVRRLSLEMAPALAPEELQRIQTASTEERERRQEALLSEQAELEDEVGRKDAELLLLQDLCQDCKRRRGDVKEQQRKLDEECSELSADLTTSTEACAALQAGLDAGLRRIQQRRLPVPQLRDDDADLREERRKCRAGARPVDRARQLHEALVAALQQERASTRERSQRETALKQVEDELKELQQSEVKLRRELEDRRALALESSQLDSSQVSSQASSIPASAASSTTVGSIVGGTVASSASSVPRLGSTEAARRQASSVLRKEVTVEVATPHGSKGLVVKEDDDDLVYGTASSRRAGNGARAGLFSQAAASAVRPAVSSQTSGLNVASGGAKFGALLGGKTKAGGRSDTGIGSQSVQWEEVKPLRGTPSAMETLFAKRRT